MQIIHLIPNSNKSIILSYIRFINENFNSNEHKFIIISNGKSVDSTIQSYENVKTVSHITVKDLLNITKENNKIILHYLKFKTSQMLALLFFPVIFNKIIWVAWGADLYQWKENAEGKNLFRKVKIIIKNTIALYFRRCIKYFVGIFPPDIKNFKKQFKSKARTFYASYTSNLYNSIYKKQLKLIGLKEKVDNNDCINIQIGHSSSKILNHEDVLIKLEKYKDENIKIFIPLSYGDMDYGDKIQRLANDIFGSKAVCIREMIPRDKYMEFLSTIDIAIFNTNRQIGLGNISPLLFMEKKIFMPKGSTMYDFYKSNNIDIWDYNEIQNLNYNEFVSPILQSCGRDYIIENELNVEKKIKMWGRIFELPLK